MAKDMQWPSEDEDFDAVLTAAPKKAGVATKPATKKVNKTTVSTAASKPTKTVPVAASEPEAKAVAEPNKAKAVDVDPVEAAFAEDELDDLTDEEIGFIAPAEPTMTVAPQAAAAVQTVEPSYTEEVATDPEPESAQDVPVTEAQPQPNFDRYEPAQVVATPTEPAVSKPKPKTSGSAGRTIFEILLILALLGVCFQTYRMQKDNAALKREISTLNANPQLLVQKQTDELITKVAALMTLPAGEVPTVANVSDAAKAKQQSNFFTNAQNGDRVLLYVKAGEAILYRPSTNKIILVAPLTFNNSTAATANSTTTTKPTH